MTNRADYANETNHDAMKIIYFEETDTLLIEMNNNRINETYDVAPDMIADVDSSGCLVALTVEHAGNHPIQPILDLFEQNQTEGGSFGDGRHRHNHPLSGRSQTLNMGY